MRNMLIFLYLTLSLGQVSAARLHPEKHYQDMWCAAQGGQVEVVLPDKTRVDCLTGDYAIEFDFADKADEALGQSLRYAAATGKSAGIVLIIESEKAYKYVLRLYDTLQHHGIKVKIWVTMP